MRERNQSYHTSNTLPDEHQPGEYVMIEASSVGRSSNKNGQVKMIDR